VDCCGGVSHSPAYLSTCCTILPSSKRWTRTTSLSRQSIATFVSTPWSIDSVLLKGLNANIATCTSQSVESLSTLSTPFHLPPVLVIRKPGPQKAISTSLMLPRYEPCSRSSLKTTRMHLLFKTSRVATVSPLTGRACELQNAHMNVLDLTRYFSISGHSHLLLITSQKGNGSNHTVFSYEEIHTSSGGTFVHRRTTLKTCWNS